MGKLNRFFTKSLTQNVAFVLFIVTLLISLVSGFMTMTKPIPDSIVVEPSGLSSMIIMAVAACVIFAALKKNNPARSHLGVGAFLTLYIFEGISSFVLLIFNYYEAGIIDDLVPTSVMLIPLIEAVLAIIVVFGYLSKLGKNDPKKTGALVIRTICLLLCAYEVYEGLYTLILGLKAAPELLLYILSGMGGNLAVASIFFLLTCTATKLFAAEEQ